MQSLAIKYRPSNFGDVVEQEAIRTILEYQIQSKTHKHSYLFTGGAGTGKTTCARIFAQELNQHKGAPIEIDAASNNGVDNVRDIIDGAKFKALDSDYKVYIIDECHMLSTGAWNAMLKLLEEPPAQSIFIFCTTDPQKIPATILSRTQRYDFKRISHAKIVARLQYIMEEERKQFMISIPENADPIKADSSGYYDYTEEALEYIATLADGGMRDAITLLDKCLSYSDTLVLETVVKALGVVDYTWFFQLTEAILTYNPAEALALVDQSYLDGMDLKQLMRLYIKFLVDVYKWYLTKTNQLVHIPIDESYLKTWGDVDYAFIPRLIDFIIKLNGDIKWDSAPKALIEAQLILLCQPESTGE